MTHIQERAMIVSGATHKTIDTDGWVSYWRGTPNWHTQAQEWEENTGCSYVGGEPGAGRCNAETASMSMEKL